MSALLHTSILGLPPARIGKVREVYDLGDELLIVATDRISAFDCIMANGIPNKGWILTQMSAFWFEKLKHVCPNQVISVDNVDVQARLPQPQPELNGRSTIAKKAKPLPIECVARGYISGSLYKEYRSKGPTVHGFELGEGLLESAQLARPIFTPATKAETGHDENISYAKAVDMVGAEVAELVRDWTLTLYREAAIHSQSVGLILADTKFEFGETEDGIILIDEALTPDSSRYWDASKYRPGGAQPSFDKQFVRDFLEETRWDKTPPGPELPPDVVSKTLEKYVEAYESITGGKFTPTC